MCFDVTIYCLSVSCDVCMYVYIYIKRYLMCVFYHLQNDLGLAYAAILRYGYHIRTQTIRPLHSFP